MELFSEYGHRFSLICLVPLIRGKRQPPECVVANSEAMGLVGDQENQKN